MNETTCKITQDEIVALGAACTTYHARRREAGVAALRGCCKCGAAETYGGGPCSLYAKLLALVTAQDSETLVVVSPTGRLPELAPNAVTRGFWKHYKGPQYFVHGTGFLHDETRLVVVYDSTRSVADGALRLRYADEFVEVVNPRTGAGTRRVTLLPLHLDAGFVPRFTRITDD